MKRLLIPITALGLLAIAWAAQSTFSFKDRGNNMVVSGMSRQVINMSRNGITFMFAGSRVTGIWKEQGLTLVGSRIEGEATGKAGQKLTLKNATVSGDVTATMDNAGKGKTVLESASLRILGGAQSNKIEVPNALTLSGTTAKGGHFTIKGSSAEILTPVSGSKDFSTAQLRGPVAFTNVETDTANGKTQTYTVNGTADRVDVDNTGASPTVTLTGNVHVTGEHPTIYGDLSGVNKAVITMDANFEIQQISTEGGPARVSAKPKGKG